MWELLLIISCSVKVWMQSRRIYSWCLLLRNHSINKVGRSLRSSFGPTPLLKPGHLQPVAQDQVCVALIGWRAHHGCGQPVPGLDHAFSEKELSDVQREPPVFSFVPVASCPGVGHRWTEPSFVFFTSPYRYLKTLISSFFPVPPHAKPFLDWAVPVLLHRRDAPVPSSSLWPLSGLSLTCVPGLQWGAWNSPALQVWLHT